LRNVAIKYPFNYGAVPQTWESPNFVHPDTQAKGKFTIKSNQIKITKIMLIF